MKSEISDINCEEKDTGVDGEIECEEKHCGQRDTRKEFSAAVV
jgi:hypothetical protein